MSTLSAVPEEFSPPRKLYNWLKGQYPHPQFQIVYVDGGGCKSFDLIPYLRANGLISSEARLAQETELVELVWGDDRGNDRRGGEVDDEEEHEYKYLMGKDAANGSIQEQFVNGYVAFKYEGIYILLYKFDYVKGYHRGEANFLVWKGDSVDLGHRLVREVYRWERVLQEEAWCFDMRWKKSKDLYQSIQYARPEDIVLPDNILTSLVGDVESFFSSQARYKELGVAWKRGILLVGPPGNGKTESIKAVLKAQSDKTFLYAKSFDAGRNSTPEQGMRAVFEKARMYSPCILVMEDLDALVTEETRSYLLNEIDGLENNDGILLIASSNHPERLDNAFSKRPSRFDTKYHFHNPSPGERKRFILKWLDEKLSNVDLGSGPEKAELIEALVEGSSDWSYAFLKELFVSFALVSATTSRRLERGGVVAEASTPSGSLLLSILAQLQSHISDEMEMDEQED